MNLCQLQFTVVSSVSTTLTVDLPDRKEDKATLVELMSVLEVSSVSTVFSPEYHHTKDDKVTSVEPMSVVQVSSVSTSLPEDSPASKKIMFPHFKIC